jgi:hypothetical protein
LEAPQNGRCHIFSRLHLLGWQNVPPPYLPIDQLLRRFDEYLIAAPNDNFDDLHLALGRVGLQGGFSGYNFLPESSDGFGTVFAPSGGGGGNGR